MEFDHQRGFLSGNNTIRWDFFFREYVMRREFAGNLPNRFTPTTIRVQDPKNKEQHFFLRRYSVPIGFKRKDRGKHRPSVYIPLFGLKVVIKKANTFVRLIPLPCTK